MQPLEKVVRVPRVAPPALAAGLAAAFRPPLESGELPVGEHRIADAHAPDQHARQRPSRPAIRRDDGHDQHGQGEERGRQGLGLKEEEQPSAGGCPPLFAEGAVTAVFGTPDDPVQQEIDRQPRGP